MFFPPPPPPPFFEGKCFSLFAIFTRGVKSGGTPPLFIPRGNAPLLLEGSFISNRARISAPQKRERPFFPPRLKPLQTAGNFVKFSFFSSPRGIITPRFFLGAFLLKSLKGSLIGG